MTRYVSYGSIYGTLVAIPFSTHYYYQIIDINNEKTICNFSDELVVKIPYFLMKRILVSGRIFSKEDGTKIAIDCKKVEIFPCELRLPTIEEIVGILK